MDQEDAVTIRLADPTSGFGVFDEVTLILILEAMYDTAAFQLAGSSPASPYRYAIVEGRWRPLSAERYESRFNLNGRGGSNVVCVNSFGHDPFAARGTPLQE